MYKVEIDSRGNKTIELLHLNDKSYSLIFNILNEKNHESYLFKLRNKTELSINWFDEKTNSISLIIKNENYYDFENYINKSLN